MVYSTYLGGNLRDYGKDIVVNQGYIYVTGRSESNDFPISSNAYQTVNHGNWDTFLVKFNPGENSIRDGTFFRGSEADYGNNVFVDTDGVVFLSGGTSSIDFPGTSNSIFNTNQGGEDFYILKFIPGNPLLFSSYFGGKQSEKVYDMLVGTGDIVYLTGRTGSISFPITINAFDNVFNGNTEAFVSKFYLPFQLAHNQQKRVYKHQLPSIPIW